MQSSQNDICTFETSDGA